MCTALTLQTKDHYFGRNLDLDCSYGEEVCIMPRNFPQQFRKVAAMQSHFALIGMGTVVDGIPLFYDATNEYGLSMAGLNFPDNAFYGEEQEGKDNICSFEFIPWILGQCKTVAEARALLNRLHLIDIAFSESLPSSPLHWMIADQEGSIVVESMKDGLHIYDNPVGVLTNNPPFPYHLFQLNQYRGLKVVNGENTFLSDYALNEYCQGLGALGLPGDVSSMSRFVREVFHRENSVCPEDEASSVSQFFHLLSSVQMARGICKAPSGKYDITVYTSCINMDKGLYYYTTYDNQRISCVDLHRTDLDSAELSRYPLVLTEQIDYQNQ